MSADLIAWFRTQLDNDERVATDRGKLAGDVWNAVEIAPGRWEVIGAGGRGVVATGLPEWEAQHIALHDPVWMRAEVDANRRMLVEHEPEWRIVEWPHDQNGKGEAQVCRRCQNVEHTRWNPPVGHADILPEGFVTPYVLAPCATLRVLALPYADRPSYQEKWRP